MEARLRAGIAVYNAGQHHAAHDAWEQRWLDLEEGRDHSFLQGLIQFTAAVYHARRGNWSGATGLADGAGEYLAAVPEGYREVNVGQVRGYLERLAADPECIERRRPPQLTHRGTDLGFADLGFEATAVAAEVLGEEHGYDGVPFERAIEYAREDMAAERTGSQFVTLLFDFLREPDDRAIIAQRLREHTERRRQRDDDVDGLFDG